MNDDEQLNHIIIILSNRILSVHFEQRKRITKAEKPDYGWCTAITIRLQNVRFVLWTQIVMQFIWNESFYAESLGNFAYIHCGLFASCCKLVCASFVRYKPFSKRPHTFLSTILSILCNFAVFIFVRSIFFPANSYFAQLLAILSKRAFSPGSHVQAIQWHTFMVVLLSRLVHLICKHINLRRIFFSKEHSPLLRDDKFAHMQMLSWSSVHKDLTFLFKVS